MLDAAPQGTAFIQLILLFAFFLAAGFALKAAARRIRPVGSATRTAAGSPVLSSDSPRGTIPKGPGIARKFKVFFLFQSAMIGLSFWWLPGLALFFLIMFGLSTREIIALRSRTYPTGYCFRPLNAYGLLSMFGFSLTAYMLFAMKVLGMPFPPEGGFPFLAMVFLLVAVADGYSQITGQILGGPKIVPRISPGKTWSGFLGGTLFCAAAAWLGNRLIFGFMPGHQAACMGGAIAVLAFLGDISASWVKRSMGLKDFSRLLGPQGGALDRGDSLIWLGPALWLASGILQAGPAWASNR